MSLISAVCPQCFISGFLTGPLITQVQLNNGGSLAKSKRRDPVPTAARSVGGHQFVVLLCSGCFSVPVSHHHLLVSKLERGPRASENSGQGLGAACVLARGACPGLTSPHTVLATLSTQWPHSFSRCPGLLEDETSPSGNGCVHTALWTRGSVSADETRAVELLSQTSAH